MGDDTAAQVGLGLSLIKRLGSCKKRSRVLNLKVNSRMLPIGLKFLNDQKKRSRDKALRLLESWLPSQPNITDDIMKKLWEGLFYCVWDATLHSRGGLNRLIDRLFSLLPLLHNPSISLHYFSTFLLTVRREWCAVNTPRLYTFKLLIRSFLHYSFAFLDFRSWDLDLTSRLISILEDTCFSFKQGKKNSFGVSYHIASVFLEELRPFLPLRPEVLEVVFKPFISVLGSLPDEVLIGKVKSNIFDVLLEMGNKLLELKKLGDDNDDAVVLGTIPLTMGFSSKFFELDFSDECCQWNMNLTRNRKVLSVLYSQFLKLEKDLESSGIQVSNPCGIEQVPTLIPIGTDMEVGGLEKPLKKKKKKASGGSGGKKKKNVAAEAGLDNDVAEDVASACELPKTKVNDTVSKKRKRMSGEKMIGITYHDGFYNSFNPFKIFKERINQRHFTGPEFWDPVYSVLPKKIDFYYSDGMLWNTKYFYPPELVKIPLTLDEACRNTMVALKIFLSSGRHSKWIVSSGAVISEDGLVLTCAHLLRDYEKPEYHLQGAKVVFFNRHTYKVKVIAEDVGKDLALLKIDHPGELKFSHAPLATPEKVETGMNAYMMLNPHYFLLFQLTEGTIRYGKRLYRDLEFENFLKLDHDTAIIQTDIDYEKGNFGGPIFNSYGEIMGVQFADSGTSKLGIHVESISIFLAKYPKGKEH